jgi:hypothetical protein
LKSPDSRRAAPAFSFRSKKMSTDAQIRANQANAQHSTGPKTEEGKSASSKNNFHHGLTGASFSVLSFEDPADFEHVLNGLRIEHQPATMTESILVENMARAYWLSKRALRCQDACFTDGNLTMEEQTKRLALFIRYQTTHDRAFHRNLTDLLKLRAEKRKEQIGFDSQKRENAIIGIRQSAENRRLERHKWDVMLAEAKVDHQILLNSNVELDRELAATRQANPAEARKAA